MKIRERQVQAKIAFLLFCASTIAVNTSCSMRRHPASPTHSDSVRIEGPDTWRHGQLVLEESGRRKAFCSALLLCDQAILTVEHCFYTLSDYSLVDISTADFSVSFDYSFPNADRRIEKRSIPVNMDNLLPMTSELQNPHFSVLLATLKKPADRPSVDSGYKKMGMPDEDLFQKLDSSPDFDAINSGFTFAIYRFLRDGRKVTSLYLKTLAKLEKFEAGSDRGSHRVVSGTAIQKPGKFLYFLRKDSQSQPFYFGDSGSPVVSITGESPAYQEVKLAGVIQAVETDPGLARNQVDAASRDPRKVMELAKFVRAIPISQPVTEWMKSTLENTAFYPGTCTPDRYFE